MKKLLNLDGKTKEQICKELSKSAKMETQKTAAGLSMKQADTEYLTANFASTKEIRKNRITYENHFAHNKKQLTHIP